MLPQLTANLIRAEHLAVRASLQRRIKHGVCPARSSLLISVVLTGLTSLSWRHTWGTWTPPRCSWTCTRYSPNNHRLRALTAFLALRWKKNQTQNIVEKRSAFTAQNQSFLALCFQSDSCNKATNSRHEQFSTRALSTDRCLSKKALLLISATVFTL